MKSITHFLTIIFTLLFGLSFSQTPLARAFWEIKDESLAYVAMAKGHQDRPFVAYNPSLCDEIGAACGFLRDHEHAHFFLNDMLQPPADYSMRLELRADCWVAKTGRPAEILAAVELFRKEGSGEKWLLPGDLRKRAENIRSCAMEAGNWIGDS